MSNHVRNWSAKRLGPWLGVKIKESKKNGKINFLGRRESKKSLFCCRWIAENQFCILGTSKNQLFAFWDLEKINFLRSGKFKKPTFHQLENVKISKHENLQLATFKKMQKCVCRTATQHVPPSGCGSCFAALVINHIFLGTRIFCGPRPRKHLNLIVSSFHHLQNKYQGSSKWPYFAIASNIERHLYENIFAEVLNDPCESLSEPVPAACSHFHFVGNGARLPPCRHHETKKYTAIVALRWPFEASSLHTF